MPGGGLATLRPMRRALILSSILIGALAPTASAQTPQPTPTPTPVPAPAPAPEPARIRPGVFVAGVEVSNLTVAEARNGLRAAFAPAYRAPVVINVAGKRFVLKRKAVKFRFKAQLTAQQALAAGAASPPAADGSVAPVALAPVVTFSRKAVSTWVGRIRDAVKTAPVNATIAYSIRHIVRRHAKSGRALRTAGLRAAVAQALADPASSRVLAPGLRRVPAKIGLAELRKAYPVVLTIEQSTFTLRLFKKLKLAKTYRVAVGQPAYPTPNGTFAITSKQVDPVWTAPNSPWAGELAGQSVAGGAADNPLKARWMGLAGGVGIHGTGQPWSIGTRASHGCIRMTVSDVVELFAQVPMGAPVFIG
jgi:lipoprotein-anchoring transpeptidase ErfK/SrfK